MNKFYKDLAYDISTTLASMDCELDGTDSRETKGAITAMELLVRSLSQRFESDPEFDSRLFLALSIPELCPMCEWHYLDTIEKIDTEMCDECYQEHERVHNE